MSTKEPAVSIVSTIVYSPNQGFADTEAVTRLKSVERGISVLEKQVKALQERAFKQVLLHNLRSARLVLRGPLFVSAETKGSEIIVNCPDIDIYGVGETEQEAIADFSENLEDFFYLLKGEGEKNLNSPMLYIWRFIKKLIVETNATKSKRGRRHI